MGNNNYDIIIAGGGMVGASLACSLIKQQDLRIALVETVPAKADQQPSYDDRGLALSMSSRRILQKVDVWPEISASACTIRQIHVSDRGHFGCVRLHAGDMNVDALGHVVIARELGQVLMQKISAAGNIDFICPAEVSEILVEYNGISVGLTGTGAPEKLSGKLLVAADGSNSKIRQQLGIATLVKDYQQTAIVTNVTMQRPHQNTAYERFTETGPIALLPLDSHRCVLVCTVPTTEVETYLGLEQDAFMELLGRRFGRRLGRFCKMGSIKQYPLKLIESQDQVASRVVLLGNSAHTIHPNGAQGFNLCLRDVAALSEHLVAAQQDGSDIGDRKVLDNYLASRESDQRRVMQFSDRLTRLFYNRNFSKIILRNTGMLLTDLMPSIKRELIRQAMGIAGQQPAMVSGTED